MTDAILANETLCAAFGFNATTEWDDQVSAVSVLNLIIYIVAVAAHTMEWLHDQFRNEVEQRISATLPGTVGWYWNKIMQFQYGHTLNKNASYDVIDPEAMIIKHCAVVEVSNGIIIKVNKGQHTYDVLSNAELDALKSYVNAIKFAGTQAYCYSFAPDELFVKFNIWRDPMILDDDMTRHSDEADVIFIAVNNYLDSIAYGGVFNKSKLLDAVQAVEGVLDVTIDNPASSNGGTTTNI